MLGLQGILTNPAGSLGISIGNMEIAIDYLSNIDGYEPDLTEIKTNISKKPHKEIIRKQVVKPKLSRENLINKYSLVAKNTGIQDDVIFNNDKILQEDDDFDFNFDDLEEMQHKTEPEPMLDEEVSFQEDKEDTDDYVDSDEFEVDGLDEFENSDEFEIDGFDDLEFDNTDEDEEPENENINTNESIIEVQEDFDEPDEQEDEFEIDGFDELDMEDDGDTIEGLDEWLNDEDEQDDEQDTSINKIEEKQVYDIPSQPTKKVEQVTESNTHIDDIQKQIDEQQKQNDLLKELSRLREENERLKKLQHEDKIETPKGKIEAPKGKIETVESKAEIPSNKKDELDVLIDKASGKKKTTEKEIKAISSPYDKYSVMKDETLYNIVKAFMLKNGVRQKLIDQQVLNNKFGPDNIKKLIVKQYLIKTSKGVTIGI